MIRDFGWMTWIIGGGELGLGCVGPSAFLVGGIRSWEIIVQEKRI
jgi:hypothetical protein